MLTWLQAFYWIEVGFCIALGFGLAWVVWFLLVLIYDWLN